MSKTTEICTTYKVLEIREPIGVSNLAPIVIIAEKDGTKERRRIEIYHRLSNEYKTAQKIIVGDTLSIVEWAFADGRRMMKDLIVNFKEEEMTIDEF
jgi:hypothetical protein